MRKPIYFIFIYYTFDLRPRQLFSCYIEDLKTQDYLNLPSKSSTSFCHWGRNVYEAVNESPQIVHLSLSTCVTVLHLYNFNLLLYNALGTENSVPGTEVYLS